MRKTKTKKVKVKKERKKEWMKEWKKEKTKRNCHPACKPAFLYQNISPEKKQIAVSRQYSASSTLSRTMERQKIEQRHRYTVEKSRGAFERLLVERVTYRLGVVEFRTKTNGFAAWMLATRQFQHQQFIVTCLWYDCASIGPLLQRFLILTRYRCCPWRISLAIVCLCAWTFRIAN